MQFTPEEIEVLKSFAQGQIAIASSRISEESEINRLTEIASRYKPLLDEAEKRGNLIERKRLIEEMALEVKSEKLDKT